MSSDILYIPSVLKALDHQSLGSFVAFRWVFGSNEQHHHRTIAAPKPHISPNEAMKIEAKKNGTILRKDEIEMILSNSVLFGKTPPFCHQPFPGLFGFGIGHGRYWVIRSWGWDRGQLCWQPVLFFTSFTTKSFFFHCADRNLFELQRGAWSKRVSHAN